LLYISVAHVWHYSMAVYGNWGLSPLLSMITVILTTVILVTHITLVTTTIFQYLKKYIVSC